jgi:transcriptional regulator with XRE-family HTH domain
MLNIEDFVQRMQLLMDYYNISASVFADKLTVQRSSLSHLMSGRNKPSLDFVMRITEAYPEADLYWLLYGKGEFPRISSQSQTEENLRFQSQFTETAVNTVVENEPDLFSGEGEIPGFQSQSQFPEATPPIQTATEPATSSPLQTETETVNSIERIVIFYKNGTFKNYNPGQ